MSDTDLSQKHHLMTPPVRGGVIITILSEWLGLITSSPLESWLAPAVKYHVGTD